MFFKLEKSFYNKSCDVKKLIAEETLNTNYVFQKVRNTIVLLDEEIILPETKSY